MNSKFRCFFFRSSFGSRCFGRSGTIINRTQEEVICQADILITFHILIICISTFQHISGSTVSFTQFLIKFDFFLIERNSFFQYRNSFIRQFVFNQYICINNIILRIELGISRSIHKCLCCSESFIIIFQLIIVIHRQTFQNKIIWIFYNHFIYKIQRFLILLIKEKQCCITRLIAFEMIGISHITCISFYRLIIFAILKICFGQFALCNSRIRFQF